MPIPSPVTQLSSIVFFFRQLQSTGMFFLRVRDKFRIRFKLHRHIQAFRYYKKKYKILNENTVKILTLLSVRNFIMNIIWCVRRILLRIPSTCTSTTFPNDTSLVRIIRSLIITRMLIMIDYGIR